MMSRAVVFSVAIFFTGLASKLQKGKTTQRASVA
jgi:hypothetical protein